LTDYEGSLHNSTYLADAIQANTIKETEGYFPIPLKVIEGNLVVNSKAFDIPLGAEIVSINEHPMEELIKATGMYYTTDGYNETGRWMGLDMSFSRYYRYYYGKSDDFTVVYKGIGQNNKKQAVVKSVGFEEYLQNDSQRHSKEIDEIRYDDLDDVKEYTFNKIDSSTAILTIHTFSLDDKIYEKYLDSVFTDLKEHKYENLIIDIRNNGVGSKPNDMLTVAYLADTPQKEVAEAWISFTNGMPYWKYFYLDIPFYQRPIARVKFKKYMKNEVPIVKNGRRYYRDIEIYEPRENRFEGQVYLLISPAVASAASLFAALVKSNTKAIVIGEETSGGYYEHNGSFAVYYKLPKSKLYTNFSIANLTQDVKELDSQPFGRGVMPDIEVTQSLEDFLENRDTQMEFTLKIIEENKHSLKINREKIKK